MEFLPKIILAWCPGVHNSQQLSGMFQIFMKQVFMLLERRVTVLGTYATCYSYFVEKQS